MKLYEKRKFASGLREIYLLGRKVYSYANRRDSYAHVVGQGNLIENLPPKSRIDLFGEDCVVSFAPTEHQFKASILVGSTTEPTKGCRLTVGEDSVCEDARIILGERGSEVTIGRDVSISYDVEIRATDCHAIFDANGKVINRGRYVHIGDHVWIGAHATILKNVEIPSGSIVAGGAVVTASSVRDANGESVILAGNPARIIRRGGFTFGDARPDLAEPLSHRQ